MSMEEQYIADELRIMNKTLAQIRDILDKICSGKSS